MDLKLMLCGMIIFFGALYIALRRMRRSQPAEFQRNYNEVLSSPQYKVKGQFDD